MFLYNFIILALLSCSSTDKKIFIKSVQGDSSMRVDWYFYSLPTSFSRSYIQLSNADTSATIFESFYISDFTCKSDTLSIQLYRNDYKIDSTKLLLSRLKITIDTSGGIWNQASSRLGRLQKKNTDYFKPHFENSYCPNGECN